ncbi:MAG: DEAD/DEAH box helicase [Bacteroidales bacterium]|nr:DEAD/DEAH box helicase [Bacteroidales bacterium]MBN2750669.1 DEAD/DEAH box helicase [Bacteroidales bacterium]
MTFDSFNFHPDVMNGINAIGFSTPTPIQEKAIPIIQEGKDLIGCAQTGTGKTAAFLLPIINKLALLPIKLNYINTLIIVPTRELAIQIDQQLEGFGYFAPVSSIAVYGGNDSNDWSQQRTSIENGAEFVVATPGRLIQHIKLGYVKLNRVEHLILDEADRMLDMGFYEDIMGIVALLPQKRQTLLFSATMPDKIRQMGKKIMQSPEEINISVSKPAENVLQAVYVVEEHLKISLLESLLVGKADVKSVIVFASTKVKVKAILKAIEQTDIVAKAIHSDLDQKEREEVLRMFKNRSIQVLVATDIISRGIDIEDIDLVVNFDVPSDPEDYVHRIGRTARAQSDGVALTFVHKKDKRSFDRIEDFLGQKIFKIPTPEGLNEKN